jgi:hypothetical protein
MHGFVEWALGLVVKTLAVLILAILIAWLWGLIVSGLLKGPEMSFAAMALLLAIISVGSWNLVVFRPKVQQ